METQAYASQIESSFAACVRTTPKFDISENEKHLAFVLTHIKLYLSIFHFEAKIVRERERV